MNTQLLETGSEIHCDFVGRLGRRITLRGNGNGWQSEKKRKKMMGERRMLQRSGYKRGREDTEEH